ncbi:MAG: GAF domain-containing protein [Agriterribacter sp.]
MLEANVCATNNNLMLPAPLPFDELQRLQDLYAYDILDTHAEPDFDELVELASSICGCPISLVTLVDKDRQWFKAKTGIDFFSTKREFSFCAHTILQNDVMVVEDAKNDERFSDNPCVAGDLHIRFYAGAPIISPAGHKLGTLCIADRNPRTLSADEHRYLVLLSNQVTKLLEIRKRNIVIRERAAEIIKLKSDAINRYIGDVEHEKKIIARDLHEQFAQEIASSLMYLKMAEKEMPEKQLRYILSAKEQLDNTLHNIRNLSYKISPLANQLLDTGEMVSEYVKSVAATCSFKILLNLPDISNIRADREKLLTLIRTIELWLKMLNYRKDITEVSITVKLRSRLLIEIRHNGIDIDENLKNEMLQHILCDKIYSYNGSVNIPLEKEKNMLLITLPLPEYINDKSSPGIIYN